MCVCLRSSALPERNGPSSWQQRPLLSSAHSRTIGARLAIFCLSLHWHQRLVVKYLSAPDDTFFLFLSRNKTKNVLIWCSVLVIVGVYTALFLSIRRTRTATPLAPNEIEIAVRFFFIVFTDCLCWMPTILLKIMALSNVYIPSNLHAWLVVFILPVNSAINPLLVSLFFSFAFSPLTFLNVILFSTHSRRQHSEWPSAIFTDG